MMQYREYTGKVEFDADAGILHGEVLGIRDVVTFQGTSVAEVQKTFRESVDDYLAFCKQRGESPDKPCSGQFLVRIDSELHRKASVLAELEGRSLNSVVSEAISLRVGTALARTKPPRCKRAG